MFYQILFSIIIGLAFFHSVVIERNRLFQWGFKYLFFILQGIVKIAEVYLKFLSSLTPFLNVFYLNFIFLIYFDYFWQIFLCLGIVFIFFSLPLYLTLLNFHLIENAFIINSCCIKMLALIVCFINNNFIIPFLLIVAFLIKR